MNNILHFSKLNHLPHQRMRSNHSFSFSLHSHYKGIEKSFLADAMNMDAGTGSGDWFDEGTFKFQNNNHRHHHRNYILLPF